MRVLKVLMEGAVSSFRYPHFVQQVQISFDMPPPATIYGHVCSAVGDFIAPELTKFAYNFRYERKFFDFEHLHFFGKEAKMAPFNRELLFRPQMTLYLSNVALKEHFLHPRNAVVLGRSQDLMTYVDVREVELERAEKTFFCDTLLSLDQAAQIGGRTYAVTMPQYLDPSRKPRWNQFAVLHGEAIYPDPDTFQIDGNDTLEIWVDPEADAKHAEQALQRGIIWHGWV